MIDLQQFKDTVQELAVTEDISEQPILLSRISRQVRHLKIDVRDYLTVLAQPKAMNTELSTSVQCNKCSRVFRNDHALRAHVGMKHKS